MKRCSILLLVLLALAAPLAAWNVVPCDASAIVRRNAFAAKVRAAKHGDPLYVRIPFPKTDSEVVTDLVDQFVDIYGGKSDGRFTPIADAMARGAYHYDVIRVEDWSPARCAATGNHGDFYYLVIVRDSATGADVAHATVNEAGLAGNLAVPSKPELEITPIETANAKFAANAIHGRDAQYVTTWGSLECHQLRPCVAARNESGLYLLHGDDVFLLPIGGRIVSFRNELLTAQQRAKFHATLGPDDRYTSLGGDAFVVAKKIK
ncbi:MAG TPA: hypothetical protein VGQ46_18060 [Thermoanaerobaculia bacterium]|jgi:hypothetical protein|nr:hypothetical protein [Thermoanaerobaculia bacterium]